MNGFILFVGGSDGPTPDPKRVAPIIDGSTYDLKQFRNGDCLLTWGHTCGDVWRVEENDKAILVISGYLAEIESGPELSGQVDVGRYLLDQFMRTDSDDALKDVLTRIHGSFGLVFRDQVRNRTICATDRVASRPLWQCRKGSGWVVSTHSAAVALSAESSRFDPTSIGAFLLYGGPVEPSSSLFAGVQSLPSGSIFRLGSKGECSKGRWYKFRHKENNDRPERDWERLVAQRLVRAAVRIGRQCHKPAIFFSGGTDSRLAAAAMKSAGLSPLLVTLADSRNIEVRVAQLAAKALKLDHVVVNRDPHWYLRSLPRAVYETGGNYVWTHGHFSSAASEVRKVYGVDGFVLGDFCEAFSKLFCSLAQTGIDQWTAKEFTNAFDSIRLPLYRPQDRETTLALFAGHVRKEIEEKLRFQAERRFEEVCSLADDPLIIGDLCFRWEAVQSLPTFFMFLDLRSTSAERSLMFDRDVHELLEMLPSIMRNGHNLGARVINQLQPLAAWVMNSNSLLPMIWPFGIHKVSKRIKPILGRMRRAVMGKSHRTTGSWPEHSVLYVSDLQWRKCFERIIGNQDLFDAAIFDLKAVRRCWEEFTNGNANRSGDVEKLLQIGMLSELLQSGASAFAQEKPLWKGQAASWQNQ